MSQFSELREDWDVVVVGAGPAGSASAITLSRTGLDVLQVEAKRFPRSKVCGGCLNQASVGLVTDLLHPSCDLWRTATTLNRFELIHRGQRLSFPTPTGLAVDRAMLDQLLVGSGQQCGVKFLSPVVATLGAVEEGGRRVMLGGSGANTSVLAKSVVLATGLGGTVHRTDFARDTAKRLASGNRCAARSLSGILRRGCDPHGGRSPRLCWVDENRRRSSAPRRSR